MAEKNKEPKIIDATLGGQGEGSNRFVPYRKNTRKTTALSSRSKGAKPKAEKPKAEKPKAPLTETKKEATRKRTASKTPRGQKGGRKKLPTIKIIPLGGLNEIGKNITVYEYGNDIILVDCGMTFPDADMLGVDLVIPDFTYLEKNASKIRGLLVTHGHEDHIGAIPYLLKKINVPIYGSRLTLGLIEGKLKEHGLLRSTEMHVVTAGQKVTLGCFTVEFIRVNHSIPDAMAMAIQTPVGMIVQTGDFKIDYTPIEGEMIDLARFAELGKEGVLCLLSESTNVERPGFTPSEKTVGATFENLFEQAGSRRIIIATFSSNIHRVQQIINIAARTGRKVAVSGRSMVNVVTKAVELGYLKVPKDVLIDENNINRYSNDRLVLVTTGSQGEPLSALSRMASGEHRKFSVTADDYIIISATPIPGNEKHVNRVINDLLRLGAEVIYSSMYDVHVSGHACQMELKTMLSLVKPKFFIPVHGEYKHLSRHAALAQDLGLSPDHTLIADIGQVIELNAEQMKVTGNVEAGRVFVDGYGVGDVGSVVLRDRKNLAQDGIIIVVTTIESETGTVVAGPDIVSRGFVYVRESEELMEEARKLVRQVLNECTGKKVKEWSVMKNAVKDRLSSYIYKKTKRDPVVLPIIMEI